MSTESVCRVCLVGGGDIKLHIIESTELLETFERLTRVQVL